MTRLGRTFPIRRAVAVLTAVVVALSIAAPVDADERRDPVLVVGDSLCVGARDYWGDLTGQLRSVGYEPDYRCQEGAPMSWGIGQVRKMASVPETVVVALGTNPGPREAAFAASVDSMRAELKARGARWIMWVNFSSRSDAYGTKNQQLLVSTYVNGDRYVDWAERARANLHYFHHDGLHYNEAGQRAWAAEIAEAALVARSRDPGVNIHLVYVQRLVYLQRLADDTGRGQWTDWIRSGLQLAAMSRGMHLGILAEYFARSAGQVPP